MLYDKWVEFGTQFSIVKKLPCFTDHSIETFVEYHTLNRIYFVSNSETYCRFPYELFML